MNWTKNKSQAKENKTPSQNKSFQYFDNLASLPSNDSRRIYKELPVIIKSVKSRPLAISLIPKNQSPNRKYNYSEAKEKGQNDSINVEGGPIQLNNSSMHQSAYERFARDDNDEGRKEEAIDPEDILTSSMFMSPGEPGSVTRIRDLAKFRNEVERNSIGIIDDSFNDSADIHETKQYLIPNKYNLICSPGIKGSEEIPLFNKGFNKMKQAGDLVNYQENSYYPSKDRYQIQSPNFYDEDKPIKISQVMNIGNDLNRSAKDTFHFDERTVRFKPYDRSAVEKQINAFKSIRARSAVKMNNSSMSNDSSKSLSREFAPEKSPEDKFRCISLAMLVSKGPTCEDRKWNRQLRNERGGVCDMPEALNQKEVKYKIMKKPVKKCIYYDINPKIKATSSRIIQKWWREIKRTKTSHYQIYTEIIIVIQSYWRGYRVRKNIKDLILYSLVYNSFCDKVNDAMRRCTQRQVFYKLLGKKLTLQEALLRLLSGDKYLIKSYFLKWRDNADKLKERDMHLLKAFLNKEKNLDELLSLEKYFNRWAMMVDVDKIIQRKIILNNVKNAQRLKGLNKLIYIVDKAAKRDYFDTAVDPFKLYLLNVIRRKQEKALDTIGKKNDKDNLRLMLLRWKSHTDKIARRQLKLLLLFKAHDYSSMGLKLYFLRRYFNKWRNQAGKITKDIEDKVRKGTEPLKKGIKSNIYHQLMPKLKQNKLALLFKDYDDKALLKYYLSKWRQIVEKQDDANRRNALLLNRIKYLLFTVEKPLLQKHFYRWEAKKPEDKERLKLLLLRNVLKNKSSDEKDHNNDLLHKWFLIWKSKANEIKNRQLKATPTIVRSVKTINNKENAPDLLNRLLENRRQNRLLLCLKDANRLNESNCLKDALNKWRRISLKLKENEDKRNDFLRHRLVMNNHLEKDQLRLWFLIWKNRVKDMKNKEGLLRLLLLPVAKKLEQNHLKSHLYLWRLKNQQYKDKNKAMRLMLRLYREKDGDMLKHYFTKWRLIMSKLMRLVIIRNKLLDYIKFDKKLLLNKYFNHWASIKNNIMRQMTTKKYLKVFFNKNDKLNPVWLLRRPFNIWRSKSSALSQFKKGVQMIQFNNKLAQAIKRHHAMQLMNRLANDAKMNKLVSLVGPALDRSSLRRKFNLWRERVKSMSDFDTMIKNGGEKKMGDLKDKEIKNLKQISFHINGHYNDKGDIISKFCFGILKLPETVKVMKRHLLLRKQLDNMEDRNHSIVKYYYTLWRKKIAEGKIKKQCKSIQRYVRSCRYAQFQNTQLKHLLVLILKKDDDKTDIIRGRYFKWLDNALKDKESEDEVNRRNRLLKLQINKKDADMHSLLQYYFTLWRKRNAEDKIDKQCKSIQRYVRNCRDAQSQNTRLKNLLALILKKDDDNLDLLRSKFFKWLDSIDQQKQKEQKEKDYINGIIKYQTLFRAAQGYRKFQNLKRDKFLQDRLLVLYLNTQDLLSAASNKWLNKSNLTKADDDAKTIQNFIMKSRKRAEPKKKIQKLSDAIEKPMTKNSMDKLLNGLKWIGRIGVLKALLRKINERFSERHLNNYFDKWRTNSSGDTIKKIRAIQRVFRLFDNAKRLRNQKRKSDLLRDIFFNIVNKTQLLEIAYLNKWNKEAKEDKLSDIATTIQKVCKGQLYRKNNNLKSAPKPVTNPNRLPKFMMRRYLNQWKENAKKPEYELVTDSFALERTPKDPNENNAINKIENLYLEKLSPNQRLKSSRVIGNNDLFIEKTLKPTKEEETCVSPVLHAMTKCPDLNIASQPPKKAILQISMGNSIEIDQIPLKRWRLKLWNSKEHSTISSIPSIDIPRIEPIVKTYTDELSQYSPKRNGLGNSIDKSNGFDIPKKDKTPDQIEGNDQFEISRITKPTNIKAKEVSIEMIKTVKEKKEQYSQITPEPVPVIPKENKDTYIQYEYLPNEIQKKETDIYIPNIVKEDPSKRYQKSEGNTLSLLSQKVLISEGIQAVTEASPNSIQSSQPLYIAKLPKPATKGTETQMSPKINRVNQPINVFIPKLEKEIQITIIENNLTFVHNKKLPPNAITSSGDVHYLSQLPKSFKRLSIKAHPLINVDGIPKEIPKPVKYLPSKLLFAILNRRNKKEDDIGKNVLLTWNNKANQMKTKEDEENKALMALNNQKAKQAQVNWFRLSRFGLRDIVERMVAYKKIERLINVLSKIKRRKMKDDLDELDRNSKSMSKINNLQSSLMKTKENMNAQNRKSSVNEIYRMYIYKILNKFYNDLFKRDYRNTGKTVLSKLRSLPHKERGTFLKSKVNNKRLITPRLTSFSFKSQCPQKSNKQLPFEYYAVPYLVAFLNRLLNKRYKEGMTTITTTTTTTTAKISTASYIRRLAHKTVTKFFLLNAKETSQRMRLFYLIKVTKLHSIFANKKYLHLIIVVWNLQASKMKKQREKMAKMQQAMELTFMQMAHDLFGNDKNNPGIMDGVDDFMNK